MAETDLDVVIRSLARKQVKTLTDAAKRRHGRLMGMAAKAKDREAKARYRHIAKNTLLLAAAAARRLQVTAENAADSYVRSIRKAAEEVPAASSAKTRTAKKQTVKKQPTKKQPIKKPAAKRRPATA